MRVHYREASMIQFRSLLLASLVGAAVMASPAAKAQGVLDDWASVKMPPAPALKPASIDPKTTALLLFDFTTQTCSQERRPRCAASMPKMKKLLEDARARGMFVVYSVALPNTGEKDMMPEIAPKAGEPILPPLGPDKFLNSDFEKMLKDKGVQTIILNGTAAQSTVLHTGGAAALRGFNVVVPIEGMSSNEAFPELYTAYHLTTAERIDAKVTLTRVDMITYK
jgi:nicotinamidase-related amidase